MPHPASRATLPIDFSREIFKKCPLMQLRSFQGLVPTPKLVSQVAAVPYDVVNREEAHALAKDEPLNLLHVDRAEIDLPTEVDPYSPAVYEQAQRQFAHLQAQGVLIRESSPALYLYRQSIGGHSQTGIVGVCHTDDYQNDIIKKHEKTRQDKEDDRTRLVDALSANTGPIFLTYRHQQAIDGIVSRAQQEAAQHDFTAADGVRHESWKLPAEACAALEALFAKEVPVSYIADGHHRAASAQRVSQLRRSRNPNHRGNEDYNWFLCVLFPGNQLNILPYNRVVRDLQGLSQEAFLAKVAGIFDLKPCTAKTPAGPGQVCMYLGGQWHLLSWKPDPQASPIGRLDVSVLQDRLLAPLLGIDDPRTSKRIDFIGGIRGTAELERLVDGGQHAVAFSMHPVSVEQLMDIADAGQIMPPKSTWFEPKLRSGLFIHTF